MKEIKTITEILYIPKEEAERYFGKGDYPETVAVEKVLRPAKEGENYHAIQFGTNIRFVQEPLKIVSKEAE